MFKRNYLLVLLVAAILFFFFKDLTNSFYQQDEWHGLGDILVHGYKSITMNSSSVQILLGQGRVFANLLVYLFINNNLFNITPVAYFAIFLHLINSILVYFLAKKIINKDPFPFIAMIFFAINGVSQGSVTWVMSSVGTLPATFLILLSVFSFFEFCETGKRKWIITTFGFLYLSLIFKEIGVYLFLFYPIYYFFVYSKYSLKNTLSYFWGFILMSLISVGYRIYEFLSIPVAQDLFITGSSKNPVLTVILRLILYPLTSFSLIFVPPQIMFDFAKRITWSYYSFLPSSLYDLVAQTAVIDMFAVGASIVLLFSIIILLKSEKDIKIKNQIYFWLGFEVLSFVPYVVISKSFSYLESRYYYLAAVTAGILLSYFVFRLYNRFKLKGIIISLIFIYFLFNAHIKTVMGEIDKQKALATERLLLLSNISLVKKEFTTRQIFYLTGDRNFYISEGNAVPMQQGMGYTILVWYVANHNASPSLKSLIKDYYLWELNGQGYREMNSFGYGYFWDRSALIKAVKENKIKKSEVVGLYYDSKQQKLLDITNTLQDLPYAR